MNRNLKNNRNDNSFRVLIVRVPECRQQESVREFSFIFSRTRKMKGAKIVNCEFYGLKFFYKDAICHSPVHIVL